MGKLCYDSIPDEKNSESFYHCKYCFTEEDGIEIPIVFTGDLISIDIESADGNCFNFYKVYNTVVNKESSRQGNLQNFDTFTFFDDNPIIKTENTIKDIYCRTCLSRLGFEYEEKNNTLYVILKSNIL